MGPAPQLSTYQQAASSIYEPQKAAEATQLQAVRDTTKNSLESEKGQVATDYQSAIDKLTQAVQDQTGQINMLYSQRLGGNFSGLQGNDLGQMFARSNQQQSIIEQTRANKLNQITAGETNADINYNTGIAALTPKYQSLETQYAQSAYGSAVKDYNTQQLEYQKMAQAQSNSDRQYGLDVAKYNLSASQAANKPLSQQQTIAAIRSGLESVKGGDNHVNPKDLATAYKDFTNAGYNPNDFWKYFQGYWNPNQKDYSTKFYSATR